MQPIDSEDIFILFPPAFGHSGTLDEVVWANIYWNQVFLLDPVSWDLANFNLWLLSNSTQLNFAFKIQPAQQQQQHDGW